jgi:LmbE family N-acetylglucosaminyl deacetylase
VPSSTDQVPPYPEYQFVPNVYVDVEGYLETKIEAMAQYERESREYPHPRSAEGIRTYAKKRGMEAGITAAEAFSLLRELQ